MQGFVLVPTGDAEGDPIPEILQICNLNVAYGVSSVYCNVKSYAAVEDISSLNYNCAPTATLNKRV